MRERMPWLVVVALVACVDEPPGLPQTMGDASSGSTGPGTSSVGSSSVQSTSESTTAADSTTQGVTTSDTGSESTTGPEPVCGDGIADDGEDCDGDDLGGQSCESIGFSGAGLACSGCQLDASACGPMPGMVEVPEGVFPMGASDGPMIEQPLRMVAVDRFWMDEFEVTVAGYGACVADGACTEPGTGTNCNWMVAGRDDHPINCVDWQQASDYCAWAGGGTKRLPTEAEWEKAARGTDERTFPWGDGPSPTCTHVVMSEVAAGGNGCGNGSTMAVGSKPLGESAHMAQDMAGNVYEWVADWLAPYDPMDTDNPVGPAMGTTRVARGGAWVNSAATNLRSARRQDYPPTESIDRLGFRCARTPPQAP